LEWLNHYVEWQNKPRKIRHTDTTAQLSINFEIGEGMGVSMSKELLAAAKYLLSVLDALAADDGVNIVNLLFEQETAITNMRAVIARVEIECLQGMMKG